MLDQLFDRLYPLCDKNDTGDKFHYLFICAYFFDIRKKVLKPYYYTKPNIFKFKELTNNKVSLLKKICKLTKLIPLKFLTMIIMMIMVVIIIIITKTRRTLFILCTLFHGHDIHIIRVISPVFSKPLPEVITIINFLILFYVLYLHFLKYPL